MHNRARMITAHYLTRQLGIDWRLGYQHFSALLADGDVASNAGNWQWAAGTGTDPRPNRTMNMLRQASRFDPAGDYVRRYVPELAGSARRTSTRPGGSARPPAASSPARRPSPATMRGTAGPRGGPGRVPVSSAPGRRHRRRWSRATSWCRYAT
jgi:hypothetical protein